MSTEAHTIPDETVSRVGRLINAAEDQRQQAADDLKQIYADLREELRGLGWTGAVVSAEVAALKGAIAEMRLDEEKKAKREERGERVEDYLSLLTRARARGARTSDGSPSVSSELTTRSVEGSVVTYSEKAAVASQGEATARNSDDGEATGKYAGGDLGAANAGGENVESSAPRAGQVPTSNPGEGAASALPDKPKHRLRPNCLDRTNCKSGTTDHCWSCKKALAEKGEVAA